MADSKDRYMPLSEQELQRRLTDLTLTFQMQKPWLVIINLKPVGDSYYGKNRMKWTKCAPASSRTRASNTISHLRGLFGQSRINKPTSPFEALKLLTGESMLDQILERTNEKFTSLQRNYGDAAINSEFVNHVKLECWQSLVVTFWRSASNNFLNFDRVLCHTWLSTKC